MTSFDFFHFYFFVNFPQKKLAPMGMAFSHWTPIHNFKIVNFEWQMIGKVKKERKTSLRVISLPKRISRRQSYF
jgi:hypothetical protein